MGLGLLLALPVAGLWLTHGLVGISCRKLNVTVLGWTTLRISGLFFCMAMVVPIVNFRTSLITSLVGLGLLVIGKPEQRRNKQEDI